MENTKWYSDKRCPSCHNQLQYTWEQEETSCSACGRIIPLPGFTMEERRLRDAVDEARAASERTEQELRRVGGELGKAVLEQGDRIREQAVRQHQEMLELFRRRSESMENSRAAMLQHRFEAAERAQRQGFHEEAIRLYQDLLANSDREEPEICWRIMQCRYGVEYVFDPSAGAWTPTVGNVSNVSPLLDADYLKAIACAPVQARGYYQQEAQRLDRIIDCSLTLAGSRPSCEVMVLADLSDAAGWQQAMSLKIQLEQQGMCVFFSCDRELQEQTPYESRVLAALASARLLVLVAESAQIMDAPHLRSVWTRFLARRQDDPDRRLIVWSKTVATEEIPREIRPEHQINALTADPVSVVTQALKQYGRSRGGGFSGDDEAQTMLIRAGMLLEEGQFQQAYELCQTALGKSPTNAEAYILSLCAELRVRTREELARQSVPLDTRSSYSRALQYASPADKRFLEAANEAVSSRISAFRSPAASDASAPDAAGRGLRDPFGVRPVVSVDPIPMAPVSRALERPAWASRFPLETFAAGSQHTVAVREDGTVLAAGSPRDPACGVSGWRDVLSVAAGLKHTVGLRTDGTVLAAGDNGFGQCSVAGWSNVTAIAAGDNHTVGLRGDGSVLLTGWNNDGWQVARTWRDIVSVSVGVHYLAGLRADGTVAVADRSSRGLPVVNEWRDVVQVVSGNDHVVALCYDGTVLAAGDNRFLQCDVRTWRDVVALTAGDGCTAGLRRDGTVIACGLNKKGQCMVGAWRDVERIWAGRNKFLGLRRDGALLMTNPVYEEAQAVPGWRYVAWAASNPYHTVALMTDGTMAAAGHNAFGECNVSEWTSIRRPF